MPSTTIIIKNKRKIVYAFCTVFISIIYITSVVSPYWIREKNSGNIGLFESQNEHSTGLFPTHCTEEMSELDCGFLLAAKVSAVAAIIFSGIAGGFFLFPSNYFAAIPKNFTEIATILQTCLAIMTLVIFFYFKGSYYDDDGINAEYPSEESPSLKFSVSYILWIIGTGFSVIFLSVQLYLRRRDVCFGKSAIEYDVDEGLNQEVFVEDRRS